MHIHQQSSLYNSHAQLNITQETNATRYENNTTLTDKLIATHATEVQKKYATQIQCIQNRCSHVIGKTEADFEIRQSFDLHLTDLNVQIGKTECI